MVNIIDKIFATLDACNSSSSQSPRDEQNITEMIEWFNNQIRLLGKTKIFQWWNKQAESDLENVATATLPVTQASVERTFSDLWYTSYSK